MTKDDIILDSLTFCTISSHFRLVKHAIDFHPVSFFIAILSCCPSNSAKSQQCYAINKTAHDSYYIVTDPVQSVMEGLVGCLLDGLHHV